MAKGARPEVDAKSAERKKLLTFPKKADNKTLT